MPGFICIVDDLETGVEGEEFLTMASCEEDAVLDAQEAYPSGVVRAVHEKSYLDWVDSLVRRAEKKRAAAIERGYDPLEQLVQGLAEVMKLR